MGSLYLWVLLFSQFVLSLRYDQEFSEYNLNENKTAKDVLDYWGQWPKHIYNPSPANWRFPFYTLFLDRFADGNPENNDINGTVFETDTISNQYRFGGDMDGLRENLDYIQGIGIKVSKPSGVYIAGTPFVNFPWKSDSYSPLDFSLLDKHYGTIQQWRSAIDEIHRRGMYVMLDSTYGTMADLLGFEGFLNSTAPLNPLEYRTVWKEGQQYSDFRPSNQYKKECKYPTFYSEVGVPVGNETAFLNELKGCYDSDFDQYGAMDSVSLAPDWQKSLAKAALVQDRLREWVPSVRKKIEHFTCMLITSLDIDALRFDKAGQITVDAFASSSMAIRECASLLGKDNFFIGGEFTASNSYASIYLGRGREPDMRPSDQTESISLTNASDDRFFLRHPEKHGADAAVFHYSIYRALTRFLGMDGNFTAPADTSVDFVDAWNDILISNDLINVNTGKFDPRHMMGTSNQDTFRWSSIRQGTEKMLLGQFITSLQLPGIPVLLWGEEQDLYILDSTSPLGIFGRQPMTSSPSWQIQGCYGLGSSQYNDFPVEAALTGCHDDKVGMDHRDPTHPVRNIIKSFYHLREQIPSLKDGYYLQTLSKQTHNVTLPGSGGTATELGIWSVLRDQFPGVNDLDPTNKTAVWLIYHNENTTVSYDFDCSSPANSLLAPFAGGIKVKNLLAPYDEITLQPSQVRLEIHGSPNFNGCVDRATLKPFEFRAYVPIAQWIPPPVVMTAFTPGHDARIESNITVVDEQSIEIELQFSVKLDCDAVTKSVAISSTTESQAIPNINAESVSCGTVTPGTPKHIGQIPGAWSWKATLDNVTHGIHVLTVKNASTATKSRFTNSVDRLMFRIGRKDNPMIFPISANYTNTGLTKFTADDGFLVHHNAVGADKWRYSTNWESSWSPWKYYDGGSSRINSLPWSGTKQQRWEGDHVILQYWSKAAGSGQHIQHMDLRGKDKAPRRFPHLFAFGDFNRFGKDIGLKSAFSHDSKDGAWKFHLSAEWPSRLQINVWGLNADNELDRTLILGNTLNSSRLNRLQPDSLSVADNIVNFTEYPPAPYMAYRMELNDGDMRFELVPTGLRLHQQIIYLLLWILPILTAGLSVLIYMGAFYNISFNRTGVSLPFHILPAFLRPRQRFEKLSGEETKAASMTEMAVASTPGMFPLAASISSKKKRTVLLATLEYDIEDWEIKIKIGGLGVMAQLMGKNLPHHDIIWVVPCVGGVDYPIDTLDEPMAVTIANSVYEVQVQYHKLRNITYVLLDAPIFRQQTKSEPYPPRMDDLHSAIYYSAWNACIADTVKRFSHCIDIYHINDYHGAVAPLYLLPNTIPCCLSLHNAEFQGLWPLRDQKELDEISQVFNLDVAIIRKYVQFGEVFNLLHAGASYLRVHQRGFGAVGVSNKYGDRSYARYPIFWGLKEIGKLPNPDPSDTEPWDPETEANQVIKVDQAYEQSRGDDRSKAQKWAGLNVDPAAELFVFVGRWSVQKGVDLIADVFPAILEKHSNVQLICIGPVIDIVFSKPEFTALPPFIFTGAEFALIPSRDEPFGLVAVEFGRKGALGVGALVGGLGQMPGWWFPVESMTVKHLQKQFKLAIESAIGSKQKDRAMMRASSAKQRFPVARWVEDLDHLQAQSIRMHEQENDPSRKKRSSARYSRNFSQMSFFSGQTSTPNLDEMNPLPRTPPQIPDEGLQRTLSLGVRAGPGHQIRRTVLHEGTALTPRLEEISDPDEQPISPEAAEAIIKQGQHSSSSSVTGIDEGQRGRSLSVTTLSQPSAVAGLGNNDAHSKSRGRLRSSSVLSVDQIKGTRESFSLETADPTFKDENGKYARYFQGMLQRLTGKNSETDLCIEEFIVNSEKEWSDGMREVKLGRVSSRSPSPYLGSRRSPSINAQDDDVEDDGSNYEDLSTQVLLRPAAFSRPPLIQRWLLRRVFDWPVYSIILALGQIMAANSSQITLLTSPSGSSPASLYILGSMYIVTTCGWWLAFRRIPSFYLLSLPFVFYSIAFLVIGIAAFIPKGGGQDWAYHIATAFYIIGSSSGYLFFSLNFGDDGGSKIESWVYRACIIQGTQNLYIAALFFWGSDIASGNGRAVIENAGAVAAITMPISALLFGIAVVLFTGLPSYYRQTPGKIPAFYKSILRRKIIIWFSVSVVLQNYFLSMPYQRNWNYLWASKYVPRWAIFLLAVAFFIGVWYVLLALLAWRSKSHSWIMAIFAIGLGAPRWAQMLWSTSGIGWWVPWMAGGPTGYAIGARAVWLWLGVLDSIQGVGFGMILLQTLTRIHIAASLCAAQLIGTITTLIARASAPDRDGPGDVFPDFSAGIIEGISKPWFWIALSCQLAIPVGFFMFFRNEQLNKP
ncbi:uncharacterized protein N7511_003921 [Penicillium nucicola]|uniref:uncharacterized protein n=1 Tax=Penicillium nucicola TaxID=1850975 RepID=UPI00254503F3|nr:uncharacterized protein N7511_003921 [Penicillium nucicola]KAJ5766305.1 hypothetical protein N7511_003921 [Penicillium nucicola]